MENTIAERFPSIEASFNYLVDSAEKPVNYMYKPPVGVPERTGEYTRQTRQVHNGRVLLPQLALDTHGFGLVPHETAVQNFYDEQEVRTVYYPEVARLVQEFTGAEKVLVFDHNVRCTPMATRGENHAQKPVKFAHNDYTITSGPQRVRDLLPTDEAEQRLQHRFAVINVWRPIRGPVEEMPLAVCDARTIGQQDFVTMDLKYHDRTGEVYVLRFNPKHQWFYFPRMQRNEAMLLKCYDSKADGRARFTAHSAFIDPSSPPDAAPRESIEARTLVFFSPDTN